MDTSNMDTIEQIKAKRRAQIERQRIETQKETALLFKIFLGQHGVNWPVVMTDEAGGSILIPGHYPISISYWKAFPQDRKVRLHVDGEEVYRIDDALILAEKCFKMTKSLMLIHPSPKKSIVSRLFGWL